MSNIRINPLEAAESAPLGRFFYVKNLGMLLGGGVDKGAFVKNWCVTTTIVFTWPKLSNKSKKSNFFTQKTLTTPTWKIWIFNKKLDFKLFLKMIDSLWEKKLTIVFIY